ncbi:MAG TPA: hypothetical protein VEA39_00025 [Methylophilaceae bacterium]|nr:hypothetical protein [Methylophilaceae bacterium]
MAEEKLMDTWGRLEVEWREALEHALDRQSEYDDRMTKHLVYNLAGPDPAERQEIADLWHAVHAKRQAADDFISEHARTTQSPESGA